MGMTRGERTAFMASEEVRKAEWLRDQVHTVRRNLIETTVAGAKQRRFSYVAKDGRELQLRLNASNGRVYSLALHQDAWTLVTGRIAELVRAAVKYNDVARGSGGRAADDTLRGETA